MLIVVRDEEKIRKDNKEQDKFDRFDNQGKQFFPGNKSPDRVNQTPISGWGLINFLLPMYHWYKPYRGDRLFYYFAINFLNFNKLLIKFPYRCNHYSIFF